VVKIVYLAAWAAYVVASARYALGFLRNWPGPPVWGYPWLMAGVVVHGVATVWYTLRFGHPPLVGFAASLATLALVVALALWLLTVLRAAGAAGLLLAPVAAFLLGLALLLDLSPASDAPIYRGAWLASHVLLSFIGYGGLVVAAAASFMYLVQFRQLKEKRFGAAFQFFPDLDTLDRISGLALLAGFTALTLGLLVGLAWTFSFAAGPRWNMPQVLWGSWTWLVFVAALTARMAWRWVGRRRAWLNLVGFGAVLVAYLVLKWNAPEARFFL
jgi:ABC-type uncharacterized transport system permease subunit